MKCNICSSAVRTLFKTLVLEKHQVEYFKCANCGFIQTEKPFWLDEAYNFAITKLDIGLIFRNQLFSEETERLLLGDFFNSDAKFLDYGGGYGMFVRLMRDKGFDYYRHDIYCENLFAEYFDINDIPDNESEKFELLSAFEVFEHLTDPVEEIKKMLQLADNILFSTELQPENKQLESIEDWWYFIPETGQHLSLFSRESIKILAEKFSLFLYTNNHNLHLFTTKKLSSDPFDKDMAISSLKPTFFSRLFSNKNQKNLNAIPNKRESLLMRDFEFIKKKILK